MKKTRRTKGQMARELVYFCIRVLMIVLVWAMILETVAVLLDRQIDLSAILTFAAAAFGGELMLLCAKRILAPKNDTGGDYGA